MLKKKILNKPQVIKAIYAPGLDEVALSEVESILNNLWLAKDFKGKIIPGHYSLHIENIYFYAISELLLRQTLLTDIRLVLHSERVMSLKSLPKIWQKIAWLDYLPLQAKLKIKVNSVASTLFHETAIKDSLEKALPSFEIAKNDAIHIFVELYKDKLTLSISLAGEPLFKRGYRGVLSHSAPLREDLAAGCIAMAMDFAEKNAVQTDASDVLIPFAGTGTFAFEYLLKTKKVFLREYSIQQLPFYKKEYFSNIKKHMIDHDIDYKIICIDKDSQAIAAMTENAKKFSAKLILLQEDFFKLNIEKYQYKNLFIPLNPPYGIRLDATNMLYKKIALKLLEIAKQNKVYGFVLCPTESSWSLFLKTLKPTVTSTYHITQGGLDIRVCQFVKA